MYRWNRIACLSAVGACCSLAVWIGSTNAKDEESSLLVKKPDAAATQGPVLPPPAKPAVPERRPLRPGPVRSRCRSTAAASACADAAAATAANQIDGETSLHAAGATARAGSRDN